MNNGPRIDVYTQKHIDPMVCFRNAQGETVRGTIVNLQRTSLVVEVYNTYSFVQISEVLSDLTVRFDSKSVYEGKGIIVGLVNTGLTAILSVTLIDQWKELADKVVPPEALGAAVKSFVSDWSERFQIRRDFQVLVTELRAFLSDASRWLEQIDLSKSLPSENGRLREDFFNELATPLIERTKYYLASLEAEAHLVDPAFESIHRSFAQTALHPLMMGAPFVYRTFAKPLGYAGDYQMVRQILDDPRQGPNTYFQIVNTAFLQSAAAVAHRNRIDLLVAFLKRQAELARKAGRPFRILNVACGPAIEVQRFIETYDDPELLTFTLLDFSNEALNWTREQITSTIACVGKPVAVEYTHDSVHELLKRRFDSIISGERFDAVYCAGLFDYLSDKVCDRLLMHFAASTRVGGTLLVTNVHSCNPERLFVMGYLLEWYLIYRNEDQMRALLPQNAEQKSIYLDETGVNIFAEVITT